MAASSRPRVSGYESVANIEPSIPDLIGRYTSPLSAPAGGAPLPGDVRWTDPTMELWMSTEQILTDLLAEQRALDAVVAPLTPAQWGLPTPSAGWSIAHQIAHLTYFDRAAAQAISDPGAFGQSRDQLISSAMADPAAMDRMTLADELGADPAGLLESWRSARSELADAAGSLPEGQRVEWYGPSMSGRSFLTARLMEVWAHGLDIIDALDDAGVDHEARPATDRLRHIAHLGVVTRGWSYAVRGSEPPEGEVRVELTAPSGESWTWGPEDAAEVVAGPAEDFCAVVTQRRNVADTGLSVTGDAARDWMQVAQAFAGGPTVGPAPRG